MADFERVPTGTARARILGQRAVAVLQAMDREGVTPDDYLDVLCFVTFTTARSLGTSIDRVCRALQEYDAHNRT